ncbi:MAG: flagellin [Proteobacteria bacterium]|nr:flagellin [Pseudomonadota bacterium]
MTLRINHNVAAINAHRNMVQNDAKLGRTLEHLSSGLKINRGSDGPAALVISEQLRSQVAGLKQAVMNSEAGVALVQTAEASLNETSALLTSVRQLAIHAANEGVNDTIMLEADQAELMNALDSVDRISKTCEFGTKKLLDGSHGINGLTGGDDLTFLKASTRTKSSPQSGFSVEIFQEATQAQISGAVALTQDMIDNGETIHLMEGSKSLQFETTMGDSLAKVQNRLNNEIENSGMNLDVYFDAEGKLTVTQKEYGSEHTFSVISSSAGVLSERPDTPVWVQNGLDVQGSIGGEVCSGRGQVLTGNEGTNVEGLAIRFTGVADPINPEVGRVVIDSNALTFQIGGNHNQIVKVLLPNTRSDKLSRDINNESGFRSLRDIDLRSYRGAQDALLLIDKAINEITGVRAALGAVQKNALESNITSLSIAKENLINAESVIRDTDMASEMSEFTKYQIMTQAATAMLAQANQSPNNVLSLLK